MKIIVASPKAMCKKLDNKKVVSGLLKYSKKQICEEIF